jgi:hypothetical protein
MVVLNCTEPAAPKSRLLHAMQRTWAWTERQRISAGRGGAHGFVTSAEHQDIQQPNAIKPDAANAAARPTKALSASIVPNINATVAEARSSRRATTITTALECKDAANAAARLTKASSASRVLNTSAPISKARSSRWATTETNALDSLRYAKYAAKPAQLMRNCYHPRKLYAA